MSRALFRPIFETLFETTSAAHFHDFRKTLEGAKPGIYDTFPMFWAPAREGRERLKSDLFSHPGVVQKRPFPHGRLANASNSGRIAGALENASAGKLSKRVSFSSTSEGVKATKVR